MHLPPKILYHLRRKPSIVPRSSSISTSARLNDPRNISDKQFLTNSIRCLIEYLTEHNYDHPISPKILTKPTNKDYYNIVMFLFKQIDSNYTCTGKIEDEIVGMFKTLNYPFPIAKSNISAVGSPHAWPSMLASIMWLIELLTYGEVVNEFEQQQGYDLDVDDPTSSEKAFYKYLSKAYGFFMSAKDDLYEKAEQQFVSAFETKNDLIRDQIDALEKKNMALSNEIEEVKRRSAYLPELDAKRKELHKNFLSLQQIVEEKRRTRDYQKSKEDSQSTELDRIKGNITGIMREIAVLKDRVAKQEISPEDVTNMINERERLEDAQRQTSEYRQGMQRKIWELELALRDKVQHLEDTVRSYHGIAEDLKMIPQSARNARGENLIIEVDIRAKRRDQLLKTPVKAHIVPILQDLKKELTGMTLELRQELITEQESLEELEARRNELLEARDMCEQKYRRIEASYKREKESLDQATEIHTKELDLMEVRLLHMRDTASEEARITSATRRIAELKAVRNARAVEHDRKKAELIDAITNVLTMCANHRELVQVTLDDLKTNYGRKLEAFLCGKQHVMNGDVHLAIARKLLADPNQELPDVLNLGMHKQVASSSGAGIPRDYVNGHRGSHVEDSVRFEDDGLSPIHRVTQRNANLHVRDPLFFVWQLSVHLPVPYSLSGYSEYF